MIVKTKIAALQKSADVKEFTWVKGLVLSKIDNVRNFHAIYRSIFSHLPAMMALIEKVTKLWFGVLFSIGLCFKGIARTISYST